VTFVDYETHGDAMCDHEGLGGACHMQLHPPGGGEHLAQRFFADSVVNIMHKVAPGPDQEFWMETSMLVTDDRSTTPMVPGVMNNMAFQGEAIIQDAGTYRLPKDRETMTWHTTYAEFDTDIAWWKQHNHPYFLDELYVFTGRAEDIGLGEAPFMLDVKSRAGLEASSTRVEDTWGMPRRAPRPRVSTAFRSA